MFEPSYPLAPDAANDYTYLGRQLNAQVPGFYTIQRSR
jgi:hypothetical protein